MSSNSRSFTYWRAYFSTEPFQPTLQSLLHAAFDGTMASNRKWPPDDAGDDVDSFFLMAEKFPYRNYFCASLLQYTKDTFLSVIKDKLDQETVSPNPIPLPPANDGTPQRGLVGKLYFVCHGNHLIVSQDSRLRSRHLEIFLNALIPKLSKKLPKHIEISLSPYVLPDSHIQPKEIKHIVFSSLPVSSESDDDTPATQESTIQRFIDFGSETWDFIMRVLGIEPNAFQAPGFFSEHRPNVSIVLAWPHKEGPSFSAQNLTTMFRHVEQGSGLGVRFKAGKENFDSQGSRYSDRKHVRHIDDVPDMTDITEKMIDWHRSLFED